MLNPKTFEDVVHSPENLKKVVVVDEVQRVPALLDVIHDKISRSKRIFVLSGSSARKMKQKGVNLLAGRASVYFLYPFSMTELGTEFLINKSLERGLLPDSYLASSELESNEFLKANVLTYIEKEIQQEQWVRKIQPFRKFLQIAAQMNSKIINKSNIAKQVGVESSTIESYYEILEDTLLGFRLPGYETSIRKQVRLAEKFYFIDTGIVRALDKTLSVPMVEHTSYHGGLFETFIAMEFKKFIEYHRLDWSMSYLGTKEGAEIDLVISRPKNSPLLVEIKSANKILETDLKSLKNLGEVLDQAQGKVSPKVLISQDPLKRQQSGIDCIHYSKMRDWLGKL